MDWSGFQAWLGSAPLAAVALTLFAAMAVAGAGGAVVRALWERRAKPGKAAESEGQEGYIVSAVLGLLALLLGFTFSLAVERFEARRYLVLQEANAIGTTYLRAQLLPQPHRARMTDLLVRYTDNRIALSKATPDKVAPLMAVNDALVTDIWTATDASFESIKGLDFSSVYLNAVNQVIDLDASRKAARTARVPPEVFAVLTLYMTVAAGVLGYFLRGLRGRVCAGVLLALLTVSMMLILDIDRPSLGGIVEGQGPMEMLKAQLATQPPAVFDRWK